MARLLALAYGVISYLLFFVTFLYAIGFVSGVAVPRTIDTGPAGPAASAVVIDLVLMSIFAIQHSVMARPAFKRWWTRFVPQSIERSTYVLLATLALALLLWQWHAIPQVVWRVPSEGMATVVLIVSLLGWVMVLISTFLIDHFELFGLSQVMSNFTGGTLPSPQFRTPLFYKFVRHPIYLGFIIAFWAAPTMTVGHLLFAVVTTGYIIVATLLEEHDLTGVFGDDYRGYRKRVPMFLPWKRPLRSS
jgi:methanethiol S-methyltransferase